MHLQTVLTKLYAYCTLWLIKRLELQRKAQVVLSLSEALHEAANDQCHATGCALTRDNHLIEQVIGRLRRRHCRRVRHTGRLVCGVGVRLRAQVAHVGDQREAQHTQADGARDDRLVRSAHAHHVGAERSQRSALGGRLERWPRAQSVHALRVCENKMPRLCGSKH